MTVLNIQPIHMREKVLCFVFLSTPNKANVSKGKPHTTKIINESMRNCKGSGKKIPKISQVT